MEQSFKKHPFYFCLRVPGAILNVPLQVMRKKILDRWYQDLQYSATTIEFKHSEKTEDLFHDHYYQRFTSYGRPISEED